MLQASRKIESKICICKGSILDLFTLKKSRNGYDIANRATPIERLFDFISFL